MCVKLNLSGHNLCGHEYARTNVTVIGWQTSPLRFACSTVHTGAGVGGGQPPLPVCVGCCMWRPAFASLSPTFVADVPAGVCGM